MDGLPQLPEFSEKLSKSSSGIALFICGIIFYMGVLIINNSMIDGSIESEASFVIGWVVLLLPLVILRSLYHKSYINEEKLCSQRLDSSRVQTAADQLDIRIKLMEYNEKAIAYNEKNESPEMEILDLSDLADMASNTFPD
jgi:hypothetical protein